MRTTAKEPVLAIFVSALAPYVGAAMAGASTRGLCEKLALDTTRLDRAQVEKLIEAMEPGLHVYVGKEKTQTVIKEIRAAIDALGESS